MVREYPGKVSPGWEGFQPHAPALPGGHHTGAGASTQVLCLNWTGLIRVSSVFACVLVRVCVCVCLHICIRALSSIYLFLVCVCVCVLIILFRQCLGRVLTVGYESLVFTRTAVFGAVCNMAAVFGAVCNMAAVFGAVCSKCLLSVE